MELIDIEKGFGILAVYEAAGYTGEQAIYGSKSIDNWFSNRKGDDRNWDDLRKSLAKRKSIKDRYLKLMKNS